MILPIITDAHGDVHGKRETPLVTRTANVIITKKKYGTINGASPTMASPRGGFSKQGLSI
jgi:hypothetical protein